MPPKMGEAMLAMPWAISSVLESWRSPMTPSATAADSNDSMAPSTAMVMATGNRFFTASQLRVGTVASGKAAWMLKRSPIVSMQVMPPYCLRHHTATVTRTMATNEPGIFFENFGVTAMMKMLTTLTMKFHQFTVSKWSKYRSHLPTKSPGIFSPPKFSPKMSAIWVVKMVTAIPLVNPMMMG